MPHRRKNDTGKLFGVKQIDKGQIGSIRGFPTLALRFCSYEGSRNGAVVRALASHQCDAGFDSQTRRHMLVEFVVDSLSCSEWFSSRYSGFPLS